MSFGRMGALGRGFGKLGAVVSRTPETVATGGPFLKLVDAVSKLLLVNGTDRVLITGTSPTFVPTYYILGF